MVRLPVAVVATVPPVQDFPPRFRLAASAGCIPENINPKIIKNVNVTTTKGRLEGIYDEFFSAILSLRSLRAPLHHVSPDEET